MRSRSGFVVCTREARTRLVSFASIASASEGSVGASGDLAPLAHLGLALIGEGSLIKGNREAPATAMLEEILEQSGYVHERVEGSTELKLRRLIRRMKLNAHDAEVWLGILRQIRWKLLS